MFVSFSFSFFFFFFIFIILYWQQLVFVCLSPLYCQKKSIFITIHSAYYLQLSLFCFFVCCLLTSSKSNEYYISVSFFSFSFYFIYGSVSVLYFCWCCFKNKPSGDCVIKLNYFTALCPQCLCDFFFNFSSFSPYPLLL